MSDPQRPFFDRQHPATDSQRPWIEEPAMSSERADDPGALVAEARRHLRACRFLDSITQRTIARLADALEAALAATEPAG